MRDDQKLDRLAIACSKCTKCELGCSNQEIDPHIPGWRDGMSPMPKYMIVCQNPKADDIKNGKILSGILGAQLDAALDVAGGQFCINREWFYLTYVAKCYGPANASHAAACLVYLKAEVEIVKPLLVVTMGALAFRTFCPGLNPMDHLGKIVQSSVFNVKVYPTYDPSAFSDPATKDKYGKHLGLLCKLMFNRECPW